MIRHLPLVRLPPFAAIHRFGTPISAPRSAALLRFPQQGWTINQPLDVKAEGWAIVGDAEGRKHIVEVTCTSCWLNILMSSLRDGPRLYSVDIEFILQYLLQVHSHISIPSCSHLPCRILPNPYGIWHSLGLLLQGTSQTSQRAMVHS
jgi:hypothetical protein